MENNNAWVSSFMTRQPAESLSQLETATYWRYILLGGVPNPAFDALVSLPIKSGFCLCGLPGTGRHSAARAFAGSFPADFYEKKGYVTCQISGLHLLREKAEETQERVRGLFQVLSERPAILIIDSLQTDTLRLLVASEYERLSSPHPFTLFIIEEEEETARRVWERLIMICLFGLPNKQERLKFFQAERNDLPAGNWTENAAAWLSDHTEGMNFSQLNAIVRQGNYFMKVKLNSDYRGDLELAMEGIRQGDVFFSREDFENLLFTVRKTEEVKEEKEPVPAVMPPVREEPPAPPKPEGPIHLIIDNMPKVIQTMSQHVPAQETDAVLPSREKPKNLAVTEAAAESQIMDNLDAIWEKRKKEKALALNS